MPQIMLLLHMQIRRYFNKICDKTLYSPRATEHAMNITF
jgi:hypothetical protein